MKEIRQKERGNKTLTAFRFQAQRTVSKQSYGNLNEREGGGEKERALNIVWMCESQPLQDTREQQQHISTRNDIDKRRDREREMANLIEQHAVNVGFNVLDL